MDPPLVRCEGCARTWHSRTMADNLRTIGCCPRCGATLRWKHAATETDAGDSARTGDLTVAPHLVLGLPRR